MNAVFHLGSLCVIASTICKILMLCCDSCNAGIIVFLLLQIMKNFRNELVISSDSASTVTVIFFRTSGLSRKIGLSKGSWEGGNWVELLFLEAKNGWKSKLSYSFIIAADDTFTINRVNIL